MNLLIKYFKKLRINVRSNLTIFNVFAVGFILGIIFNNFIVIVLYSLLIFTTSKKHFYTLIALFSFLVGTLFLFSWNQQITEDIKSIHETSTVKNIEAAVVEDPKNGLYSDSLILKIDGYSTNTLVNNNQQLNLKYGDKVKLEGKLHLLDNVNTLNQDYVQYLKSKGVYAQIKSSKIEIIKANQSVLSTISGLRESLSEVNNTYLNSENANFVNAITYGLRNELTNSQKENLQLTGLSHLVSTSGLHVMLIYLVVSSLKKTGKVNLKYLRIFTIFIIIFYTLLVGLYNLPLLRASIMLLFIIFADIVGRKHNVYTSLLLSSFLILLIYPYYWQNISFQLSIFATIGLFVFAKRINSILKKVISISFIRDSISISIAVTITTFPFVINTFEGFSYSSILANLVILPFIQYIIIGTIIFNCLVLVFQNFLILKVLSTPFNYFISALNSIINFFANLNWYTENKFLAIVYYFSWIILVSVLALINNANVKKQSS